MANFNTHLTVSVLGSGAAAIALESFGYLDARAMGACCLAGIIGGLLPDVDSDDPKAAHMIFNSIMGLMWVLLFIAVQPVVTVVEFLILFAIVTLVIRGGLYFMFQKYSTHRGSYHSVLGALISTFLVAAVVGRAVEGYTAWVIASFCFFGFMLHLVLDELFRVNLVDADLDKPLFNALKFASKEQLPIAGIMLVSLAILWFFTPKSDPFLAGLEERRYIAEQRTYEKQQDTGGARTFFGFEIPRLDDYVEYQIEVHPTNKGEELKDDLGIGQEDIEHRRAKVNEFWEDFKSTIGGFQAKPKDQREEDARRNDL